MRISAKGRYALAAMITMSQKYSDGDCITVISIADKLGISKIYLEQVFSLLKKSSLVNSVKGAQGGYQLARLPQQITVYDVLLSIENSLFDDAEETVPETAPGIETALKAMVFEPLDISVQETLEQITLYDLTIEAEKQNSDQGFMFFI